MSFHGYSDQEWQSLHEGIQKRFQALAKEIQSVSPAVTASYGKTQTVRFPLFSHVSFYVGKRGDNDVIAGIDVATKDGLWSIDADICGEEDGTIYFELPSGPYTIASFEELRKRALAVTDELITYGKPLLLQLLVPSVSRPSQPFDSTASIAEDRRR